MVCGNVFRASPRVPVGGRLVRLSPQTTNGRHGVIARMILMGPSAGGAPNRRMAIPSLVGWVIVRKLPGIKRPAEATETQQTQRRRLQP